MTEKRPAIQKREERDLEASDGDGARDSVLAERQEAVDQLLAEAEDRDAKADLRDDAADEREPATP